MLAKSITFRSDVRCGPESAHHINRVGVTTDWFGLRHEANRIDKGHIDVDTAAGVVRLYNPSPDRSTGEPIDVRVPMENVAYWEPLSEEQFAKHYPSGQPVGFRAKPGPKPKE